jgi:hypothetical protein
MSRQWLLSQRGQPYLTGTEHKPATPLHGLTAGVLVSSTALVVVLPTAAAAAATASEPGLAPSPLLMLLGVDLVLSDNFDGGIAGLGASAGVCRLAAVTGIATATHTTATSSSMAPLANRILLVRLVAAIGNGEAPIRDVLVREI